MNTLLLVVAFTVISHVSAVNRFTSSDGLFSMQYNIHSSIIDICLEAESVSGWVAVSFSPHSIHSQSDMYVGWIDSVGNVHVVDAYSDNFQQPQYDSVQSVTDVYGSYQNGALTVGFSRKLNTEDEKDLVLDDQMINFGWAYHDSIPPTGDSVKTLSIPMHTFSKSLMMNLFSSSTEILQEEGKITNFAVETTTQVVEFNRISSVDGNFELGWIVSDGFITFRITGNALGWMALSYSSILSTPHVSTDVIMGWIEGETGQPVLVDAMLNSYDGLIVDESQDVFPISGGAINNRMTIIFKRKIDTGDTSDFKFDEKDVYIFWALNSASLPSNGVYEKHDSYGCFLINTYTNSSFEVDLENNILIPSNNSTSDQNQAISASPQSNFYLFSSVLGDFSILWKVDNNTLNMTLSAECRGWMAVSLSKASPHVNSDIYTTWIDSSGRVILLDGFSTDFGLPSYNEPQDSQILSYSMTGGRFVVSFTRKTNLYEKSDVNVSNSNINIGWAYHKDSKGFFSSGLYSHPQHTNFGNVNINLVQGQISQQEFDYTYHGVPYGSISSSSDDFKISWRYFENDIVFTMSSPTSSWLGISLSNSLPHLNSDMYIGWISSSGEIFLADMFSNSYETPLVDSQQDGKIISGSSLNGRTTIVWKRPLNTFDGFDQDIKNDFINVGWAYSQVNNVLGSSTFSQHSHAGSVIINLLNGQSQQKPFLDPGQQLIISSSLFILTIAIIRITFRVRKLFIVNEIDSDISQDIEIDYIARNSALEEYQKYSTKEDPKEPTSRILTALHNFSQSRLFGSKCFLIDAFMIFLYIAVNLVFLVTWYSVFGFPQTLGYLSSANLLACMIPASRNSFVCKVLRLPHERAVLYHSWISRFAVFTINFHGMFYIFDIRSNSKALSGFICWLIIAIVVVTSLNYVQNAYPGWFRGFHNLFIGVFIIGCLHSYTFFPYALAAGAIFILEKLARLSRSIVPVRSVDILPLSHHCIRLRFPRQCRMTYQHGQKVLLNFPLIEFSKWYDVSLSSGHEEDYLEVIMPPNIGSKTFNYKLVEALESLESVWIRVDGPVRMEAGPST